MAPPKLAGVILAGGKNSRMNGIKKIGLRYQGESFFQRTLRALGGLDVAYLSVETEALYSNYAIPQISDQYAELGPLGGICSALEQVPADALLVVPCDMPLLNRQCIDTLADDYYANGQGVFFRQEDGRVNPIVGVYPKSWLPAVQQAVQERRLKLTALLDSLPHRALPLADSARLLYNVNDPESLQLLQE